LAGLEAAAFSAAVSGVNMKKLIGNKEFYKLVATLALPLLLQNTVSTFVNLLDNLMVGQIGTEQMSGVSIVNQILFVVNLCIFGGVGGSGIFGAQFHGRGDSEGVRHTLRFNVWQCAGIVAVACLLLALADDVLIGSFLHDSDSSGDLAATLAYGKQYLRIMLWSLPPFALTNAYVGVLRSTGDTRLPMVASVTAVLVNLVFNYILIFGKLGAPAMGVEGAALATALSRYVELAIIVIRVHGNTDRYSFARGAYQTLRIPMELVKKIVVQGMPLMFNELMWSLGQTMLLQAYSVRGLDAVAAMNIANVVSNLFFIMLHTMGGSVGIIQGNLLGAGEFEKAKSYCPKLMFLSAVLCGMMGLLLFITAPWIPRLYNTSREVMVLATGVMRVTGYMLPIMALTNCCYFTIRAGGRTGITILFDSVYSWLVFVPVAMLLAHRSALSLVPMFAIVQGLEGIKAVIGIWLVRKGIWVRNIVNNI